MEDSDRVAVAAHLHVVLRRKTGRVTDTEWMACNQAYAQAMVAFALEHAREQQDEELARLARRFAHLTQRDMDVVRCVVEGLDTERLAQRLGITVASARTYLKRVCGKLGVQGQRELFALLMEPAEAVDGQL